MRARSRVSTDVECGTLVCMVELEFAIKLALGGRGGR